MNYLIWAGLRHSVPKHHSNCLCSEINLILTIDNKEFDILEKKSKDYYMLIKRIIAQCPKNSKHLCQDFNLTHSLRASSPIWAAPRSRVLARLSSLAQIGELARRLSNARPAEKSIPSSTYEVAFESYLKAFQYKVLNSILFTNKKLCKIGYTQDDKCSLCKTDSESLYHIFFECSRHTKQFRSIQCSVSVYKSGHLFS